MSRPAEMIFFLSGMWCTTCSRSVAASVGALPGVSSAEVSFSTKLLTVLPAAGADPAELAPQVQRQVQALGFGIRRQSDGWISSFRDDLAREHSRAVSWLRLTLVGFLAMWSSMFAFAGYLGSLSSAEDLLLAHLSAALGIPAILIGVGPFLRAGLRAAWRSRLLTLDLFIGLGGLCAVGATVLNFMAGSAHSYADSAAMVLLVLLLAKALEAHLCGYLSDQILSLHRQGGQSVEVGGADGLWKAAELSRVRRGQLVRYGVGDTISLDGRLTSGEALLNSHLINGEAGDVVLKEGAQVLAGAIARSPLELAVTEPLGQRAIDRWAQSALLSHGRPHPLSGLLRRLEAGLAGVALAGAVALGAASLARGAGPSGAAEAFFVGVLIFCPCLFASILPLSKQMAHLALSRLGARLYRAECLFELGQLEGVFLDKTGTLESVESFYHPLCPLTEQRVRGILGAAASRNGHPVLAGLAPGLQQQPSGPVQVEDFPGLGLQASAGPDLLLVGRPHFVRSRLGPGAPGLYRDPSRSDDRYPLVALNGQIVGKLITRQVFDATSLDFLRQLARMFPVVSILSGDPRGLEAGARFCALDPRISYQGDLTPEGKAEKVTGRALFVGDGLNDTQAMTRAAVSCRVGARAPALAPVDLEIPSGDLMALLAILRYARRFLRVLKQTAGLALTYNLLALTLAFQGLFTPLGAVLAMLASLTLLVLSSARLLSP